MKFTNNYSYVELHDQVANVAKWLGDHIYVGSQRGDLVELSKANGAFYQSRVLPVHCLTVSDVTVSADGRRIVTSSLDSTCVLTDAEDFRVMRSINCPDAFSPHCAIRSDGAVVAVVGEHGHLYVDNGADTLEGRGPDEFFRSIRFYGGDETDVVCLGRHCLARIDVETRETTAELFGASAKRDGKLKRSLSCFATHPSHKIIPVGTVGGFVQFYDITAESQFVSEVKVGKLELVESMEFTKDGNTLAIGTSDRSIKLMDIRNRQIISEFRPQRSRVLSVSFNYDNTQLVSVSEDKTVIIADVAPSLSE